MKKVRFGIIGCGKIAERNHIPGLQKNAKDAEIVAMYDIKPEKAKALAKQLRPESTASNSTSTSHRTAKFSSTTTATSAP